MWSCEWVSSFDCTRIEGFDLLVCIQVFPHEYQRALAEAQVIVKAEEEQKSAIKAAGQF